MHMSTALQEYTRAHGDIITALYNTLTFTADNAGLLAGQTTVLTWSLQEWTETNK